MVTLRYRSGSGATKQLSLERTSHYTQLEALAYAQKIRADMICNQFGSWVRLKGITMLKETCASLFLFRKDGVLDACDDFAHCSA